MLRHLYRAVVPSPVRKAFRSMRHDAAFSWAHDRLRRDPARALRDDSLLELLVYGWDNDGWSAHTTYLRRMLECVLTRPGVTVLECGSGLSTVVLGAATERTGSRVHSLEHTPAWRERVERVLSRAHNATVRVHDTPLVDFGDFAWYDVSRARFDADTSFGLVVCDGPPGDTRGGRYGLMRVMANRLAPDCVVLLDDASRAEEREIMRRWTDEFGGAAEVRGALWSRQRYAEYRPAAPRSPRADGAEARLTDRPGSERSAPSRAD